MKVPRLFVTIHWQYKVHWLQLHRTSVPMRLSVPRENDTRSSQVTSYKVRAHINFIPRPCGRRYVAWVRGSSQVTSYKDWRYEHTLTSYRGHVGEPSVSIFAVILFKCLLLAPWSQIPNHKNCKSCTRKAGPIVYEPLLLHCIFTFRLGCLPGQFKIQKIADLGASVYTW